MCASIICRFIDGLSTFDFIDMLRKNPFPFKPLFCELPEQPTAKIVEELFKPLLSPNRESNTYKMEAIARGFWSDFLIDVEGKFSIVNKLMILLLSLYHLNNNTYSSGVIEIVYSVHIWKA